MTFRLSEGRTPVSLTPPLREVAGTWIRPDAVFLETPPILPHKKTGFYVQFKEHPVFAFHFRTVQYSLELPLRINNRATELATC